MTVDTRTIAAVVFAGAVTTGLVLAQGPPRRRLRASRRPGATPPAGAAAGIPDSAAPPPEGGRQGGGGRAGGYTQYTRPLASEDVIIRGKALYGTNCASCHAIDLRGTVDGKNPNLLRSGVALRDQKGELIGARVAKHTPPLTLNEADTVAIAEYIHSVHATMGGQGSPPGRNPTNVTLNVLVGDPKNGEATFKAVVRRVPLRHRQPQRDRIEVCGSQSASERVGQRLDEHVRRWRPRRRRQCAGGRHHGRRFQAGRNPGA